MKYSNVDLSDREYLELVRFMYRIGHEIINNSEYEILEAKYSDKEEFRDMFSRTYDDDPIPYNVLTKVSLTHLIPNFGSSSKYANELDEDKTLSIKAVTSPESTWEFIKSNPGEDFLLSVKCDGDSFKGAVVDNIPEVFLSRARKAVNAIDYTHGLIKVLPQKCDFDNSLIKLYGETFVKPDKLEYLRRNYNKDFVTCKSSALSMIRDYSVFKNEDFDCLTYRIFNVEGAGKFNTKSEMLDYLDNLGLKTVSRVLIRNEQIPKDKESFIDWINFVLEKFKEMNSDVPSDGAVLEVNNLHSDFTVKEQYSNRNIALKFGPWEYTKYIGIVEDIIVDQRSIDCSVVIKIKPYKAEDNCQLTRVNGYNLSIINKLGIDIGSEIEFERSANTYSTLIYKK